MKELKTKPGITYMFGVQRLVHLFYLTTFLCPSHKFICIGPSHIGLGDSVYIFEQGLLRVGGNVRLNCSLVLSNTYTHWSVSEGKLFTSAGSVPQAAQVLDLCSGKAKKKKERKCSNRRKAHKRCMKKHCTRK